MRNMLVNFTVNEEKNKIILTKIAQFKIEKISTYFREMLIDGYVIKSDYSALKKYTFGLNANWCEYKSSR